MRAAALALLAALPLAVATQEPRPAVEAVTEDGVRAFVAEWLAVFAERDLPRVREMLGEEDFAWYEDGVLRYAAADDVARTLGAMPPKQTFQTDVEGLHVRLLGDGRAHADMLTHTTVGIDGRHVARFDGACSLLVERRSDGWRILRGHSSTQQPRQH